MPGDEADALTDMYEGQGLDDYCEWCEEPYPECRCDR